MRSRSSAAGGFSMGWPGFLRLNLLQLLAFAACSLIIPTPTKVPVATPEPAAQAVNPDPSTPTPTCHTT